jgi:CRP/FNR family cyclic AMP-dependent transcriptional regulator
VITLEKLLLFKSVDLFKQTPEEVLLCLASVATEETAEAGNLIMKKDEVGTTLHIIVSGRVKVHDEARIFAEFGERQVFGELSALLPAKRTASVTALTDSVFLKIDHENLYKIMNLHSGLARGIIHVLCNRMRSLSLQVQELMGND